MRDQSLMGRKGKRVIGQSNLEEISKRTRENIYRISGHYLMRAKSKLTLLVMLIKNYWLDT